MANEIHVDYQSGNNLYTVRLNSSGQVALSDGSAFESWGANGHDADDYDVPLSEAGSGGPHYVGDFDASSNISAGRYCVVAFVQSGASPADGDKIIGSGELVWTGAGELTSDKILANKAVQVKSTGKIEYYDDDGQTIILTHTPDDGESSITRAPS
ncbi:MAG: hypothetical protein ACYSX1_10655 [Planctomycetota bacterium]|jgi:hypothetical protein